MLKQSSRTLFMPASFPSFHGFQQLCEDSVKKALYLLALHHASVRSTSRVTAFLPPPQHDAKLDKNTLLFNALERATLNTLMRDKNCPLTMNEALHEIQALHNRSTKDSAYILLFGKYYSAGVRASHILAIESLEALYPAKERAKHPLFKEFQSYLDQKITPEDAIEKIAQASRQDDPALYRLFSRPLKNGIRNIKPSLRGFQEYCRFSD